MNALSLDLLGMLVAAFLTVCVFSYLLGDNFLFRLAVAILAGGGAGYVTAIALWDILLPRVGLVIWQQIMNEMPDPMSLTFAWLGLLLICFMLFKVTRLAWVGNVATAWLVGVGAGVAIGGAALGTVYTQVQATAQGAEAIIPVIDNIIMLAVTLAVFISFTFLAGSQRGPWGIYGRVAQIISTGGQAALKLTFGVIFATLYIASVSVLISQVQFLVQVIPDIIKQLASAFGVTL
jgi:hypothetical protein